jgi:hypothetical protein
VHREGALPQVAVPSREVVAQAVDPHDDWSSLFGPVVAAGAVGGCALEEDWSAWEADEFFGLV